MPTTTKMKRKTNRNKNAYLGIWDVSESIIINNNNQKELNVRTCLSSL